MPRLILTLGGGAQTSAVRASALNVASVQDAVEASQANAVIVSVPELTTQTREELANLPGVDGVFEDIQGIPLVAQAEEIDDFLNRVRDLRGAENVPLPIETKPTRAGGRQPRTDGGAVTLPIPQEERGPTPTAEGPIENMDASLAFVGVRQLHEQGITGESVIAVTVDTGACGDAIRHDRQLAGADLSGQDNPWDGLSGHGGMTTGIMAGDETTPGLSVGALPDAHVFPIKTTLAASELMQAQDIIAGLADDNPDKTVVVCNSWGFPQCAGICDHPVTSAIDNAAKQSRILQVFAAGNGAAGTGGCGTACDGSTPGISGPNSLPSVITVAASGRNGQPGVLQEYSSRGGPGDVACGRRKPDVSAPVFGEMPYGCGSRNMGNGGGTSAACPQVAGIVGLLADAKRRVTTTSASQGLTASARQFIDGADGFSGCSGAGNVQADAAIDVTPSGGSPIERAAGFSDTLLVGGVGLATGAAAALLQRRSS